MQSISFTYENPLKINIGEELFKNLPQAPGVYFFLDKRRRPLYIGKADNLRRRVQSYRTLKPGYAPEHILEMIEFAREIVFETHPSGEKALVREGELIRSVKPPFNIAGTDPIPHLFCALRVREDVPPSAGNAFQSVDFRLSHRQLSGGFRVYGCFSHRGKTKAGYSALLRLFHAATLQGSRLHLPSKLCRTSPAYEHRGIIRKDWLFPLDDFLRGKSPQLLHLLMKDLLRNEELAPHLYAPLQRDLKAARGFFDSGPKKTRRILAGAGKGSSLVSQQRMDELLRKESLGTLTALKAKPRKPEASAVAV